MSYWGYETRDRCFDHNFRDFWQFSAKKLAFLSKTNVMIKILHNLALFWVKNANFFADFFGENILKIITSVPGPSFVRKIVRIWVVDSGYSRGRFFKQPGVDVMITIFCDFWQFSEKNLAFFSKTNVMIKIFHNLALSWVKNAKFFAEFFGENI
jgi:hypothetical protein